MTKTKWGLEAPPCKDGKRHQWKKGQELDIAYQENGMNGGRWLGNVIGMHWPQIDEEEADCMREQIIAEDRQNE